MHTRELSRTKRHARIRTKVIGTSSRPRLSVYRGLRHIYAQIIDDSQGKTLFGASDKTITQGSGVVRAQALAKHLAAWAKEQKITSLTFDRGGFRYHGQVKVLADTLREEGITI